MNKYVLLCAAFLSSLACLTNAEWERKGKELAADIMKQTMKDDGEKRNRNCVGCEECGASCKKNKCTCESATTTEVKSCCSKCGCKTGTCSCKSVITAEEATKSCSSCCKTCGKCCGSCTSCKSAEMDEDTRCACGKPKPKSEKIDMRDARRDEREDV